MFTNNFKTLCALLFMGYPEGYHQNVLLKYWDGDIGYIEGSEYGINRLLFGAADKAWQYGITDWSNESDWLASMNTFYSGGRLNAQDNTDAKYLVLGSGDTEVTKSDYKLDSFIPTDRLRFVGSSVDVPGVSSVAPKMLVSGNIGSISNTFENVYSSPITVKEVGLVETCICAIRVDERIVQRHNNKLLLARNVLSSPITISPGEMYTFTMVIK